MRSEPVILLTLVEHDLQGANSEGEQGKSDVIEFDLGSFAAKQLRRILNQSVYEHEGQQPHGQIDEEDPAPGGGVGEPTAEGGADGGSADGGDSINRERQAAFFGREGVGENCLRHRLETSASGTLEHAEE